MIQVYSHPRSGTNYLAALIAQNFYPDKDMSTPAGEIGHWAARVVVGSNPYGALFGGHRLYYGQKVHGVYVYRDGRDVALSLWRTKAFLHPGWADIPLSVFLRTYLDWRGSPGHRERGDRHLTILEHWQLHLTLWRRSGAMLIRYEDAVRDPLATLVGIARRFGLGSFQFRRVDEPVGWYPNEGQAGTWRAYFSPDDIELAHALVPPDFWGWHEGD